jgi:UDP-glucose 4-epimerase
VTGVDCLTDYYSSAIKKRNLQDLHGSEVFRFLKMDLLKANLSRMMRRVDYVFHLAAQPGVRVRNNTLATQAILEAVRRSKVKKLIYASSSSVYGETAQLPTPEDAATCPISPYGITKLDAENLCRVYYRSYGVPVVALRYFTVYGPRQRPDMAFFRFIESALRGTQLVVYGDGTAARDFTYVTDVVGATVKALESASPGEVLNVGSGNPVTVNEAISILKELLGRGIEVKYGEAQRGDVGSTHADIHKARSILGFAPSKSLREGLREQLVWQKEVRVQDR